MPGVTEEHLEMRAQRGDRRAELVGGIGGEAPERLHRRVDALEQPIQHPYEATDLARLTRRQPLA